MSLSCLFGFIWPAPPAGVLRVAALDLPPPRGSRHVPRRHPPPLGHSLASRHRVGGRRPRDRSSCQRRLAHCAAKPQRPWCSEPPTSITARRHPPMRGPEQLPGLVTPPRRRHGPGCACLIHISLRAAPHVIKLLPPALVPRRCTAYSGCGRRADRGAGLPARVGDVDTAAPRLRAAGDCAPTYPHDGHRRPRPAVERGFVGSPAILVDGEDPVAVPGQPPALAAGCTPRRPGSPGYRRWTDWWLRWPQHTSGASAHERAST